MVLVAPKKITRRASLPRLVAAGGLWGSLLVATLPGCAPEETLNPRVDCSTSAMNQRLLRRMHETYLWNKEIPADVDPLAYDSPAALLDAIVYSERDLWSHISPAATVSAYYGEGKSMGLGVRWKFDADGAFRIAMTYEGAPAAEAGLLRGDEVLAINGVDIETIDAEGRWGSATGEDAEGVAVELRVRRAGGEPETITLHKRVYTLLSVAAPKIFEVGGRKIGYLLVDRFITPTYAGLRSAFAVLDEAQVQDLILDLRYNGGGLTEASRVLASFIGGKPLDGRAYSLTLHNDQQRSEDAIARFSIAENQLSLPRLAVITTGSSASASELVINGLDPWIRVGLIGATTYGKPVGSRAYTECEMTVSAITFRTVNADGDGGYFDGLPVDCAAEDQLGAQLGDPAEASIAEAIHWLTSNVDGEPGVVESCSVTAGSSAALRPPPRRQPQLRGFLLEVGAF
ncbi:S41 family peptidase [Chondromyces crocatus]|uniref:Peptidase n=1 Tax=Chondromyces crocatus TaxID=52 RepID=A0A0K1E8H0_CHOCO|nr:S41 family peptidase [Chondromyces crocatus]AKT37171.1 peptidase [Chondromyces crocatus]